MTQTSQDNSVLLLVLLFIWYYAFLVLFLKDLFV